ncbi:MAG: hypothetical protein HYY56_00335 [Candidatus Omnitrophica bacterium]|nr:hypothetical protein [Candidatus Omnitrophota bacterium]
MENINPFKPAHERLVKERIMYQLNEKFNSPSEFVGGLFFIVWNFNIKILQSLRSFRMTTMSF